MDITIYEDVLALITQFEENAVMLNSAAVEFNDIHEVESVYKEIDKDVLIRRIIKKLYEGSSLDE